MPKRLEIWVRRRKKGRKATPLPMVTRQKALTLGSILAWNGRKIVGLGWEGSKFVVTTS